MPSARNALHDHLTSIGLPWTAPFSQLVARYGVRRHPAYEWDVVEVPTARPLIDGLLWPLSVRLSRFTPMSVPPTYYCGVSCPTDDARTNLSMAVARLAGPLGPGTAAVFANAICRRWACGDASIELHVYPPELQSPHVVNPAHARDWRLGIGCHIAIQTGYRLPLGDGERAMLATARPIVRLPDATTTENAPGQFAPPEQDMPYIRQPDEDYERIRGWIAASSDGTNLIAFADNLYMVALDDVLEFDVTRTRKAKGPGGSRLVVRCRGAGGHATAVTIATRPGPDDLSDVAIDIARAVGKHVVLQPYDYDV